MGECGVEYRGWGCAQLRPMPYIPILCTLLSQSCRGLQLLLLGFYLHTWIPAKEKPASFPRGRGSRIPCSACLLQTSIHSFFFPHAHTLHTTTCTTHTPPSLSLLTLGKSIPFSEISANGKSMQSYRLSLFPLQAGSNGNAAIVCLLS